MEKLWYYASNNSRQGPVTETELRDRITRGEVKPDDLIWTDGMPDWVKVKTSIFADVQPLAPLPPVDAGVPGLPPPQPPTIAQEPQGPMHELPAGLQSWMKFNGLMLILQGVFYCLLGIPLIIAGVSLMAAAGQLDRSTGVSASMAGFFEKFKQFNVALGVFNILAIVGYILSILLSIIFFGAFVAAIGQMTNAASGM